MKLDEHALSFLQNGKLWASHPSSFNDPFDTALDYEISQNSRIDELIKEWLNKVAITCLSENSNSILMWSHYADKHKGVCIGIEINEIEYEYLLHKVEYVENFEIDQALLEEKANGIEYRRKLFSTKFIKWEYEEEYRLVFNLDPNTHQSETWAGKTVSIGTSAIKEIILGCKVPNTMIDIVKKIAPSHTELKKAVKDQTAFKLEYEPITL